MFSQTLARVPRVQLIWTVPAMHITRSTPTWNVQELCLETWRARAPRATGGNWFIRIPWLCQVTILRYCFRLIWKIPKNCRIRIPRHLQCNESQTFSAAICCRSPFHQANLFTNIYIRERCNYCFWCSLCVRYLHISLNTKSMKHK